MGAKTIRAFASSLEETTRGVPNLLFITDPRGEIILTASLAERCLSLYTLTSPSAVLLSILERMLLIFSMFSPTSATIRELEGA